MEPILTRGGAWHGTSYELLVELGPRSDERLAQALDRVWSHVSLDGPYGERDLEPSRQRRVAVGALAAGDPPAAFGVATLPAGGRVAAGTFGLRYETGSEGARDDEGTDWLQVYLPLGSLAHAWPQTVPFPFLESDDEALHHAPWQESLEAWLVELARHLFEAVRFRLAVVGHELDGMRDDFVAWWRWCDEGGPAGRVGEGFLRPDGRGELEWWPPTGRAGWVLSDRPGNPASWADIFSGRRRRAGSE